ncbi:MAG TPA: thiamine phosphate synthase [Vicinamibacterales bacterium]|nr:thiamine phosphate synthase [Vicinamibacterales bacterium]
MRDPRPPLPPIPNPQSPIPVLNAIVDVDAAARAGWQPIDLADAFLAGGARFLQLRAKSMPSGPMLDTAAAIVAHARHHGATVVVNDRADIARLAGADGVHVGQDDLAPAAVRTIVGPSAIIGFSTHTAEQIDRALAQPITYLAIGPVFGTTTKATGYDRVGLDMVRAAATRATVRGLPLVAIGGITVETAAAVIEAGAASVAVISDLLADGHPERRTREFLHALRR